MIKKIILILFLLFSLGGLVVAECVEGIDDVCDLNCIDVDYDCLENPAALTQDADCTAKPDGICEENCRHIDWDCVLVKEPVYDEEGELIVKEEIESIYTPPPQSTSFISSFDETNSNQFILFSIGIVLLGVALLLFFHQLRQRATLKEYAQLLPYGQSALAKGYSKDQIARSLKEKGHSRRFIKGYLKTLEHRP